MTKFVEYLPFKGKVAEAAICVLLKSGSNDCLSMLVIRERVLALWPGTSTDAIDLVVSSLEEVGVVSVTGDRKHAYSQYVRLL